MRQYGIWVIIASVIAPPPFPTKLAVLAAGVLRTSRLQLVAGVFLGRLARYGTLGYLGARFGATAAEVIRANYPALAVALAAGLLLLILFHCLRSRRVNLDPR